MNKNNLIIKSIVSLLLFCLFITFFPSNVYAGKQSTIGVIIFADNSNYDKWNSIASKNEKKVKIKVIHGIDDYSSNSKAMILTSGCTEELKCNKTYVVFAPYFSDNPIPSDRKKSFQLFKNIGSICTVMKKQKVSGFYTYDLGIPTPSGSNQPDIQKYQTYNNPTFFKNSVLANSKNVKNITVLAQGVCDNRSAKDTFKLFKSTVGESVAHLGGNIKYAESSGSTDDEKGDGSSNDNNAYVTSNDGKVKDKEHLFGDSGAPARYTMSAAKYYDVAVPYDTTLKEIGGYATSASSSGSYHYTGSKNDWKTKQNGLFNIFNTTVGELKALSNSYTNFAYDDKAGGLAYVKIGNIKCYTAAIGQGLYANSAWGLKVDSKGEPNWTAIKDLLNGGTPVKSGLFYDLLLKDGTQIHFIAQSMIGLGHAVGGPQTSQDKITYTKAPMKYKQYIGMWHSDNPWQMVECSAKSGSSAEVIRKALGITKDNPVMYVRVWNASLYKYAGKVMVASGMEDGVSKGDALSTASDGSSSGEKKEVSDQYMKGMYDESQLSAWTKIVNEKYIDYASKTRDSLSQSDLNSLSSWEQNVKYDDIENHGIFKYFRYGFMFIAIMMMVYAVLLYCCFWFDKVNPLFDISLLYIVTFGKLTAAPTEEEVNYTVQDFFKNNKGKSKFVNHKYMLIVCLSMIFFSLMIITGSIFKIIFAIINWISNVFGF